MQRLSDTTQIAVNVANGTLKYTSKDASLPGSSGELPITIDRFWSSHQAFDDQRYWHGHAYGWSHNFAQTYVGSNPDGSVYYSDPTAARYRFAPNGSGGYVTPTGLDASLCKVQTTGTCLSDGVTGATYRLTVPSSGLKYYYLGSNRLGAIKDAPGHTVLLDYSSSGSVRITGSDSRLVTFGLDGNGNATNMVAGTSSWLFALDSSSQLTAATLPSRGTTTYEYNSDRQLTKIIEPGGNQTRFEWGWTSRGAVVLKKVIRVLDPADPTNPAKNPTVTYTYDFASHQTVVTDAAGNATATPIDDGQTTYRYDERLNVTSASPGGSPLPVAPTWANADGRWDTTRPVSTPTGTWVDLDDDYVDGVGTRSLTLAATDDAAGAGVRRVALEEVGGANIAAWQAPCQGVSDPPVSCPAAVSRAITVDTAPLNEGAHVFRQVTQDVAGNTALSAPWTVYVDRTAPGTPATDSVRAFYDDGLAAVVIYWAPARDPELPDGTPGADNLTYSYRVSTDGGPYGSWSESGRPVIRIPGASNSSTFRVQVAARDQVGNVGQMTTLDPVSPTAFEPQAICDEAFGSDAVGRQLFCETTPPEETARLAAAPDVDSWGLTNEEKRFCAGHPYHCKLYWNDAEKAQHATERLFTGQQEVSDGTRANAFQHAYWNALMVESDNDSADLALQFSTAHEGHAYDSSDQTVRYRSLMDMENNYTGYLFGKRWSPTKNDRFMCRGMLDNNRNSGEYIEPDVDPHDYMYWHAQDPRQEIWRKRLDKNGVRVNPTGLKC